MAFNEKSSSSQFGDVFEEEFFEFISTNCQDELMQILKDPRELAHYPILIDHVQLNVDYPTSAMKLLRYPDTVLASGEKAVRKVLQNLYDSSDSKEELKLKRHVHLRVHSMPEDGLGVIMTAFPGCEEAGIFMTLVGTVVKTSPPGLIEFKKEYKCSKCKQIITVMAPLSRNYYLPRTMDQCENLCVGAKLEALESGPGGGINEKDAHRFKDRQEIKLQEQIKHNDFGTMPKTMWVILEDDLVDSCKPGDDVTLTGKLFLRFKPFRVNQPIEADLAFLANHVEVKNDQRSSVLLTPSIIKSFEDFWKYYEDNPFEGRNRILRSFCPQVYGMYLVKLAMSVVLAGGVSKEGGGSRVRGESHLLLVGDPGTGKSQLLKYASKLTPRSVFTTGAGTTTAGLTVAAVKEGGNWHLEAGALVLADGGVCCIDEFSNIKQHDRISIHEAMEQQTISIAKAGLVSKLETRCTIMAATNPKFSKYDSMEDVDVNVGLPSPLLSRFDLVIVLKDACNEAWDSLLCDFILGDTDVFEMAAKNAVAEGSIWDTETLRSYMVLIKENEPKISEDADQILSRYYHLQRNSSTRNVARTTVRLLESLFRLAEGHARLMSRKYVLVHDAIIAISLMEASMQASALTQSLPNPLHIAFPENPLEEYYSQAKMILNLLGLPELWRREEIYLENLRRRQNKFNGPPPPVVPSSSVSTTVPRKSQTCSSSTGNDDCRIIASTRTAAVSTNYARSQTVQYDPTLPKDFFETDDGNDDIPCSCRIVTSTQDQNGPQQGIKGMAEPEILSPIAPVPQRIRNVLKTSSSSESPNATVSSMINVSPSSFEQTKRKRTDSDEEPVGASAMKTCLKDDDTGYITGDCEVNSTRQCKESQGDAADKPSPNAQVRSFRSLLSVFKSNKE